MTPHRYYEQREVAAYNAGVLAVAAVARATADRLALRIPEQPTRLSFAIGALDCIVEGAEALLLSAAPKADPIVPSAVSPPIRCGDPAPAGTPIALPAGLP